MLSNNGVYVYISNNCTCVINQLHFYHQPIVSVLYINCMCVINQLYLYYQVNQLYLIYQTTVFLLSTNCICVINQLYLIHQTTVFVLSNNFIWLINQLYLYYQPNVRGWVIQEMTSTIGFRQYSVFNTNPSLPYSRFTLVGIVSFGESDCGARGGRPGVYFWFSLASSENI